jgi:CHAD domain-containing protein
MSGFSRRPGLGTSILRDPSGDVIEIRFLKKPSPLQVALAVFHLARITAKQWRYPDSFVHLAPWRWAPKGRRG